MGRLTYRLTAPRGLGDSLYLRAMAVHLTARGDRVAVDTIWPSLFDDLSVEVGGGGDWVVAAFSPKHRLSGMWAHFAGMDQFSICCARAGIEGPVDLDIAWKARNARLCREVRKAAGGRKVVVYQPRKKENPRLPLDREVMDGWLSRCEFFRVRLGHPSFVHDEGDADLDLFGRTTVRDALDVVSVADMVFGELCYLHVAADALQKPSVCVLPEFSRHTEVWGHLSTQRLFRRPQDARLLYG